MCHNVLSRLGCSAHASAAVAASCQATWFSLQYDDELTSYSKGVLPGDPEADLWFTIVIKEALDEIHQRLVAAGLAEPVAALPVEPAFAAHLAAEQRLPLEVSYVDDSVFLVAAAARSICDHTAQACAIIQDTFDRFGLPINFAPGKTEVVLGLHGKGSKVVRAEVYCERV